MALVDGSPDTVAGNLDAAMKQLYIDSNEAGVFYDERPAFGLIPKDEGMGGRNEPVVVHFSRMGGRSASFAYAQTIAAVKGKKVDDFLITPVNDWSFVRVNGDELARRSKQQHGLGRLGQLVGAKRA